MKADALLLTKLYDTFNKAYVIPNYQRPFAWDPQKAIDLLESILEDAREGAKVTSLGTLLFCEVLTANRHPFGANGQQSDAPNTIWEVVDGQQRMTVLSMIGFALKGRLETLTSEGLQYSPPIELELLLFTSRRRAGTNVPVLIRDEDNFDTGYKSDLARLLDSFARNQSSPPQVGQRLLGAYEKIKDWVKDKLDKETFVLFCEYLLSKCQIIQVLADDQDTAFMMFEPLNSTSEPLTAFEVYRSQVMRNLQPVPDFAEIQRLLDYDNTKRDEVIKRSNALIFNMAQVYSGERPRVNFVHLKQYLDRHVKAPFVNSLESGAIFFHSIWLSQTLTEIWFDEETKNCIRFLRASQHDASIPIIMRYFQTDKNNIPAVVKIIVAFYSLWRPVFPTNSLPDIYRNLLKKGSSDNMAINDGSLKSPQDLAAYFRDKLETRLKAQLQSQTPEAIWLATQRYLNYGDLKTICRLFIFLDMGASIKSNLLPDDPWTSLEDMDHILPRNTTQTSNSINLLGNLTFLPEKVNKSIKDMAWKDKREIYALLASTQKSNPQTTQFSDGRLPPKAVGEYLADSNCPSLAYLQRIASNSIWGESEIGDRTTAMLKNVWQVLYKQWLYP